MSVSARYWRLRATAAAFGSVTYQLSWWEVEFRDTGGTHLLPSLPTASASSEWSPSWSAQNAFDGSTETRWLTARESELSTYQWLAVDAGGAISPVTLAILPESSVRVSLPAGLALETGTSLSGPWTVVAEFEPENVSGWQTFEISGSGIARPLIDGWGHSRHIDSRMMIR